MTGLSKAGQTVPKIHSCKCGALPKLARSAMFGIQIMRVECGCGRRGATLMYGKPVDAERMHQAAVDVWNLADS